jgi:hypothetical protein
LAYLAPSDCPSVDAYLSHVRARSTSLELREGGGAAADSVDVRLDPELDRPGWLGQLRIEGSRPLEREVHGERCQDVVEALALITVLRLEGGEAAAAAGASPGAAPGAASGSSGATAASTPGAAPPTGGATAPSAGAASSEPAPTSPAAQPPAAEPQPPSSPTPTEPAEPPGSPTAPAEPAPDAPSDASSTTDEAPEGAAAPPALPPAPVAPAAEAPSEPPLQPDEPITVPAGTPRVEVDSVASGTRGEPFRAELAPTLALLVGYASVPGNALDLTLASEVRYGETLRSWTSPIALRGARGSERVDAADLDITLLTAQLGLCPPAPLAEGWAWLRLCANVRAGGVYVEISPRVPELRESPEWRPWLAVVPSLEIGVPLSERWTIRASAELAVQLVRDTFGAALDEGPDPDVLPLYKPEAVSVEGGLGVGYTF